MKRLLPDHLATIPPEVLALPTVDVIAYCASVGVETYPRAVTYARAAMGIPRPRRPRLLDPVPDDVLYQPTRVVLEWCAAHGIAASVDTIAAERAKRRPLGVKAPPGRILDPAGRKLASVPDDVLALRTGLVIAWCAGRGITVSDVAVVAERRARGVPHPERPPPPRRELAPTPPRPPTVRQQLREREEEPVRTEEESRAFMASIRFDPDREPSARWLAQFERRGTRGGELL